MRSGRISSFTFVSPAALDDGLAERLGLRRRLLGVRPTREVGKADMKNNDALPAIDIDPETFAIKIDGDLVEPAPAERAAARPALRDVLMGGVDMSPEVVALMLADGAAAHRRAHPVRRARAGRPCRPGCRRQATRATSPAYARDRLRTVTRVEAARRRRGPRASPSRTQSGE